jgi:16S rRNA (guanine527-N7)-methyltransferase
VSSIYGPEAFAADINVPRETLDRLKIYAAHLAKWQASINLIGPSTLPHVWQRHMLDSAQLTGLAPEVDPSLGRRLDLGAGAGFPGLVIAIITGDEVHLIESNAKKCVFLREIVRLTAAANVTVHNCRIEDVTPWPVDIVVARAFAPLDRLFEYAVPFFGSSTTGLFLKGQHLEEEIVTARKSWNFEAELLQSRSDEKGQILKVGRIERAHGS